MPTVRLSERQGKWVLAVTVLGSAVSQLTATVVNIALPAIGRDLHADVGGLQWTINGYLLTLAALILLGGSIGDRFGRRRIFIVGILWFSLASILCAVSPTVDVLIAARVVQGIGGALLTPGSLSILQATMHPDDRAKAIGAWSALGAAAGAAGPVAGGWLLGVASWRWVFLVNVPLGVFVAIAGYRYVPETRDPDATGGFDASGALLATLGLGGVTYALIAAGAAGFASATVLLPAGIGLLAIVAFVENERRIRHPMLPLGIFASRRFTAANLLTFVVYAALGGLLFFLVVVLQTSLGYSPVAAGAADLPLVAIMATLSAPSGALAQRIGPRLQLTVGPLLIAASMLMLLRVGPGASYVADVLPAVVVLGLGLAATVAPVTATALGAAEDRHAGAASGVNNAVARTAQLVAVAALPLIAGLSGAGYRNPRVLSDAFHTSMIVTAGLAVAGALVGWFGIGGEPLPVAAGDDDELSYQCTKDAPPLTPDPHHVPAA